MALIGQPIKTLNQSPCILITEWEREKSPLAHIWLVSQLKFWPCVAHLWEDIKTPQSFSLICKLINNILLLYPGFVSPLTEKPSSFNYSNSNSDLSNWIISVHPELKLKQWAFQNCYFLIIQTKWPLTCIKDNFNYLIILMTIFFYTTLSKKVIWLSLINYLHN